MNSEQQRLEKVLQYFLENHCDDPINGTKFDCDFIDAIRELQNKFADKPKFIIDYRKLLKKYIQEIIANEGIPFIPILEDRDMFDIEMTLEEHNELLTLEAEIETERV